MWRYGARLNYPEGVSFSQNLVSFSQNLEDSGSLFKIFSITLKLGRHLGSTAAQKREKPWYVHCITLRLRQNSHVADSIFKPIFFNKSCFYWNFTEFFFPIGPIKDKPALVLIMAWNQTSNKPLSETMMDQFTDDMHHSALESAHFMGYTVGDGHGPLTRYVKLWVVHAPGMPKMYSPPSTSKETTS